jgi:L-threonylcarbamoyladenylate synthase
VIIVIHNKMRNTELNLKKAINDLENDKLIAIPTETVYGLAANASSETAIKKIFTLKKRPESNPLILHIKSINYLKEIAENIPEKAMVLANNFWPGPLTLILVKKAHISELITSGKDTVAVRVPNHPLTLKLLENLNFPIVAPSANPYGSISPTSASHVEKYFKNHIDCILDGDKCEKGIESTIIGFRDNQPILYRYGAIPIEHI